MDLRIVATFGVRLQVQIANQLLCPRVHVTKRTTQRPKDAKSFGKNSLRLCGSASKQRYGMIAIGARQKVAFAPPGSSTDT